MDKYEIENTLSEAEGIYKALLAGGSPSLFQMLGVDGEMAQRLVNAARNGTLKWQFTDNGFHLLGPGIGDYHTNRKDVFNTPREAITFTTDVEPGRSTIGKVAGATFAQRSQHQLDDDVRANQRSAVADIAQDVGQDVAQYGMPIVFGQKAPTKGKAALGAAAASAAASLGNKLISDARGEEWYGDTGLNTLISALGSGAGAMLWNASRGDVLARKNLRDYISKQLRIPVEQVDREQLVDKVIAGYEIPKGTEKEVMAQRRRPYTYGDWQQAPMEQFQAKYGGYPMRVEPFDEVLKDVKVPLRVPYTPEQKERWSQSPTAQSLMNDPEKYREYLTNQAIAQQRAAEARAKKAGKKYTKPKGSIELIDAQVPKPRGEAFTAAEAQALAKQMGWSKEKYIQYADEFLKWLNDTYTGHGNRSETLLFPQTPDGEKFTLDKWVNELPDNEAGAEVWRDRIQMEDPELQQQWQRVKNETAQRKYTTKINSDFVNDTDIEPERRVSKTTQNNTPVVSQRQYDMAKQGSLSHRVPFVYFHGRPIYLGSNLLGKAGAVSLPIAAGVARQLYDQPSDHIDPNEDPRLRIQRSAENGPLHLMADATRTTLTDVDKPNIAENVVSAIEDGAIEFLKHPFTGGKNGFGLIDIPIGTGKAMTKFGAKLAPMALRLLPEAHPYRRMATELGAWTALGFIPAWQQFEDYYRGGWYDMEDFLRQLPYDAPDLIKGANMELTEDAEKRAKLIMEDPWSYAD